MENYRCYLCGKYLMTGSQGKYFCQSCGIEYRVDKYNVLHNCESSADIDNPITNDSNNKQLLKANMHNKKSNRNVVIVITSISVLIALVLIAIVYITNQIKNEKTNNYEDDLSVLFTGINWNLCQTDIIKIENSMNYETPYENSLVYTDSLYNNCSVEKTYAFDSSSNLKSLTISFNKKADLDTYKNKVTKLYGKYDGSDYDTFTWYGNINGQPSTLTIAVFKNVSNKNEKYYLQISKLP